MGSDGKTFFKDRLTDKLQRICYCSPLSEAQDGDSQFLSNTEGVIYLPTFMLSYLFIPRLHL